MIAYPFQSISESNHSSLFHALLLSCEHGLNTIWGRESLFGRVLHRISCLTGLFRGQPRNCLSFLPYSKLYFGIDSSTIFLDIQKGLWYYSFTTFRKANAAPKPPSFSTEYHSDTIFTKPTCTVNESPQRLPFTCFLNVVFKAYKSAVPFPVAAPNQEVVMKFNTRKANKELGRDAAMLLNLLMSKDLTSRYGCPNEKILVDRGLATIDNKARGWGLEIYSNEKACREAGYYVESAEEKERREAWEASQESFWARHNSLGVA